MLDRERFTNHLEVDGHASAVVGAGYDAADVVGRRAALLTSLRQVGGEGNGREQ